MIISKAPLRVSLVGGGTDFKEYFYDYKSTVISFGLDKFVYVFIKPKFDGGIKVTYSVSETVSYIREIKNQFLRDALIFFTDVFNVEIENLEIVVVADVPSEGTGLGSSSALIVALFKGLLAHFNITRYVNVASLACEYEIDFINSPIGVQDQYASAYGGINRIHMSSEGVYVQNIEDYSSFIQDNLLIFSLGGQRKANSILKTQQANIGLNLNTLHTMRDLSDAFYKSMLAFSSLDCGKIIDESWRLKKSLAPEISNPVVDEHIDKFISLGAIGCKLNGAGGTGFLSVWAPNSRHSSIINNVDLPLLGYTLSGNKPSVVKV